MITFGPPRKDVLKAHLANKRWEAEASGIVLNGVSIATDRVSQSMIGNAVSYLREDPSVQEIEFKSDSGFVTVPRAQMVALGKAVGNHIQACFSAERSVLIQIDNGTVTTTSEVEAALAAALA